MNIKACIFDLDGVIVDTAHYHFIAWRRLANHLGFDFDETANEQLKGVGRMESLDIILGWGGVTLDDDKKVELASQKNEWYKGYINEMQPDEILEGVPAFLEQLAAKGIRMAIGSSSKNAQAVLRQIGIADQFDAIIDGTKLTRSKPDPQVFQLGAEEMEISPAEIIVFEDAASGIEAALNGGFYAVGIGAPENLPAAQLVLPNFIGVQFEDLVQQLPVNA
jgi:beta-phosphoglucomutase